jgi:hypothetical protein
MLPPAARDRTIGAVKIPRAAASGRGTKNGAKPTAAQAIAMFRPKVVAACPPAMPTTKGKRRR